MFTRPLLSVTLVWVFGAAIAMTFTQASYTRPSTDLVGGPYKVIAAEFTGDQVIDLALGYHQLGVVTVEQGDGCGQFSHSAINVVAAAQPNQVKNVHNLAHADIDNDGLADLAVGDLDADGDIDFVVTHWTEDFMSVFLNKGNGSFSPRRDCKTDLGNYGVTLCDVDRDRKLDAVTANYRARSISVLKGVGDGTFQPAVTTPKGLRLRDGKWESENM